MGMILRIASSRIVGQGDIVGRSGYFSLNLSANSVMRGRLDARRTLKSLVADLRMNTNGSSDSDIIGIDEVCKMTGMSKYTVYKKTSNREIPFYKSTLGRRSVLRFVRSEIRTWMLRHRIGTVDEFLEEQDGVYNK